MHFSKICAPFITVIVLLQLSIIIINGKSDCTTTEGSSCIHIKIPHLSYLKVIHKVDKRFLSFAFDSYELYLGWKRTDLTNKRLSTLTKYLRPAYLRLGGTAGDALKFSNGNRRPGWKTEYNYQNNISSLEANGDQDPYLQGQGGKLRTKKFYGEDLRKLNQFVQKAQLDLIFGLNVLVRSHSHWNSSNALELLKCMSANNMRVAGWELGNEPDRFPVVFNKSVKPGHISRDVSHLRHVLNQFPIYKTSLIIGPDMTQPDRSSANGTGMEASIFLRAFLRSVNQPSLDVVSIHQYYFDGRSSIIDDFLNTTIMDTLTYELHLSKSIARRNTPGKPIWLGETSSAWGGGTTGISGTFASVFMWLDKLGQSALNGVQVVIRQTLIGGHYGLLDQNVDPTPDYFVSLLFKRFVGEHVLSLPRGKVFPASNKLRMYAHCTKRDNKANDSSLLGAVTIYIINPTKNAYLLEVERESSETVEIEEYLLQAPNKNLTSIFITLNKKILRIDTKRNKYPKFKPKMRKNNFRVPSLSVGFWVLRNANVKSCQYRMP